MDAEKQQNNRRKASKPKVDKDCGQYLFNHQLQTLVD
jgi:hypothetical protein